MSNDTPLSISININMGGSVKTTPLPLPEPTDDRLHCELWVECTNPQCFTSGCANMLAKQAKEACHV